MNSKKKVLVPFDFSSVSENLVRNLQKWIPYPEPKIWLLHVIDQSQSSDQNTSLSLTQSKKRMDEFVESLTHTPALAFQTEAREGFPPERICQFASEKQIDLIVLLSHERSQLPQYVLGSVAEHVLHMALRPVLLLPGPTQKRNTDQPPLHNEGRIEQLVQMAERVLSESDGPHLKKILDRLRDVAIRHFAYEESPTGLYAEILEQHPHLENAFQELRMDHKKLLSLFDDWAHWADTEMITRSKDIHKGLEILRNHESREKDLILEAYYRDLVAAD